MRAFLTGGTGFLGGCLAGRLRERGDELVALVRSPERARDLDAELVQGDLSDRDKLAEAMRGCDAVFHVAAMYEVGIPESQRPAMYEANVTGTENVVGAAVDASVARIVYVSTVNAFGNTRGAVVDETHRRSGSDFVSYYDETKYLAHVAVEERIAGGAPVVVAMPGTIYGPGDHSELGEQLELMRTGKLRFRAMSGVGITASHIDDVADGVLLAYDRGRIGESYVLAAEPTTLGAMIETVARLTGRRPPRLSLPTLLLKLAVPLGPLIGRTMGTGPNLRELISASDGVTYWASDAKARRELGWQPRGLEEGLRDLVVGADSRGL